LDATQYSGSKDALPLNPRQVCHINEVNRLALLADIAHPMDQMVG
jgi:hypothetical protein